MTHTQHRVWLRPWQLSYLKFQDKDLTLEVRFQVCSESRFHQNKFILRKKLIPSFNKKLSSWWPVGHLILEENRKRATYCRGILHPYILRFAKNKIWLLAITDATHGQYYRRQENKCYFFQFIIIFITFKSLAVLWFETKVSSLGLVTSFWLCLLWEDFLTLLFSLDLNKLRFTISESLVRIEFSITMVQPTCVNTKIWMTE